MCDGEVTSTNRPTPCAQESGGPTSTASIPRRLRRGLLHDRRRRDARRDERRGSSASLSGWSSCEPSGIPADAMISRACRSRPKTLCAFHRAQPGGATQLGRHEPADAERLRAAAEQHHRVGPARRLPVSRPAACRSSGPSTAGRRRAAWPPPSSRRRGRRAGSGGPISRRWPQQPAHRAPMPNTASINTGSGRPQAPEELNHSG